jgi:hypothetical protein
MIGKGEEDTGNKNVLRTNLMRSVDEASAVEHHQWACSSPHLVLSFLKVRLFVASPLQVERMLVLAQPLSDSQIYKVYSDPSNSNTTTSVVATKAE